MQIVNINQVRGNKNNPRVIKDERFKKLVESIKFFPEMLWKRSLVVESNEKGYTVLGGNQRLRAINEIFKMPRHELQEQIAGVNNEKTILAFYDSKQIPITLCDDWTLEQKREFIVRDNIDFGQWDMDKLSSEYDLEELEEWGLEPLEGGKEDLPAELENDSIDDADKIKTNIKVGDLIEIGRHRLLCGDSTKKEDVERLMNGKKADMVFTDPPYGMNAVSKSGVLKERYSSDIIGDSDTSTAKNSFRLIYSMYPDIIHVWWGANYYSNALPDSECWLVWDKNNGASDQTDCELAWSNARSVVRKYTQASEKTDRVHPTQKPVGLVVWAINKFTKNVKIIFDGFLGSGVVMVACQTLDRICYGMELEPLYCQVIINRMRKNFPELEIKVNGKEYQE